MFNSVILDDVPKLQFLIVQAGGMATKSLVEDMLMLRHNIDRYTAHEYTNENERLNVQYFRIGNGIRWIKGDAPALKDYPEVNQVEFKIYKKK